MSVPQPIRLAQPSTREGIRPATLTRPSQRLGYVVPRLFWLAIGPAVLVILSVLKLESHSAEPGWIDVGFVTVAATILMIRWGNFMAGYKYDSFGGRMGIRGLLEFSGMMIATASAFWILSSLVATQQLPQ